MVSSEPDSLAAITTQLNPILFSPIPPPPDLRYVVVGEEGIQHKVTLYQVREWAEHAQISQATHVYSVEKGEWRFAADFPEIAVALVDRRQRRCTQLAFWGVGLAVLGYMLELTLELSHSYTLMVFGFILAFAGFVGAILYTRH